jgi:hypothetical protein
LTAGLAHGVLNGDIQFPNGQRLWHSDYRRHSCGGLGGDFDISKMNDRIAAEPLPIQGQQETSGDFIRTEVINVGIAHDRSVDD